MHLPYRVEAVENEVEVGLGLEVFEGEHGSLGEPEPAQQDDGHHTVAWRALVIVQHQAWVKELVGQQKSRSVGQRTGGTADK